MKLESDCTRANFLFFAVYFRNAFGIYFHKANLTLNFAG